MFCLQFYYSNGSSIFNQNLTFESNYESYTGIKAPRNCESIRLKDKLYSSTIKLSIGKMNKKTIIAQKWVKMFKIFID